MGGNCWLGAMDGGGMDGDDMMLVTGRVEGVGVAVFVGSWMGAWKTGAVEI